MPNTILPHSARDLKPHLDKDVHYIRLPFYMVLP